MRRWGIADKLAKAAPFGVEFPSNISFVTRLAGPEIARIENAMNCAPSRDERYSEHAQWIPQYKLEAVLMEHAASLDGVTISYGQEFLSLEQRGDTVEIRVRDCDSNVEYLVKADFLIGADGSRSTVREQIGVRMVGSYGLSRNYNTIFRAPGLADAHAHGPAIMYWQINAEVPSLIGPMDEPDIWFFMPTMLAEGVTYADHEVAELIRRSTGIDSPYEILSSDLWVASRLLADRYSMGRVFLVGDACHLHPPFGGYGMNMGVADSVELGWKIAAVLQGWGGQVLLDSYEIERRPAHNNVMNEAEANHALAPNKLFRPGIEALTAEGEAIRREVGHQIIAVKTREFHALGVVLGYRYQESPVIVYDTCNSNWKHSHHYVPCGDPGCLAPHKWMKDGRSLYDMFGPGFTLLVLGKSNEDDVAEAEREAERTQTPLQVVRLSDTALVELFKAYRVLVRPDQYIAWRGERWPENNVLLTVTGRHKWHGRPFRCGSDQHSRVHDPDQNRCSIIIGISGNRMRSSAGMHFKSLQRRTQRSAIKQVS
jgi:2-polyprenyl-6-methoxyphenol hydroxylase-like FAD-dependent oxidoreductase